MGPGCVKTSRKFENEKIDLSERPLRDFLEIGKGHPTHENFEFFRFYTAWVGSGRYNRSAIGPGCVKTSRKFENEKIDLSERPLRDFLEIGKGHPTHENFEFFRFYTAWTLSRRTAGSMDFFPLSSICLVWTSELPDRPALGARKFPHQEGAGINIGHQQYQALSHGHTQLPFKFRKVLLCRKGARVRWAKNTRHQRSLSKGLSR